MSAHTAGHWKILGEPAVDFRHDNPFSAPELLAALKRVMEICDSGEDLSNADFFGSELAAIRGVISKAEGTT